MLALASRVLCTGALATVAVSACAPATSGGAGHSNSALGVIPISASSRVIDAERIQRTGSMTAFDAIWVLVPGFRAIDTRPLGSSWRGLDEPGRGNPRVILDGHPVLEVETLRMLRADQVLAIHVLSAPDATIRFGPGFTGGAILIQTTASLRRL
jgi:hypothetical protein